MKQKEKVQTVCIKLSKNLLDQIDAALSGKSRSEFIREAIIEKLSLSNNNATIMERLNSLESELYELKEKISIIERELPSTHIKDKADIKSILMASARDDIDLKIINFLLEKGYVKISELVGILPIKRRQIVNRLRRLSQDTGAIKYITYNKNGVTKAWWLTSK
ncbi:MAG: ribbon-helix-helix domain-containing protein [Candidatus Asgardarchaeia archaeon]